MAILKTKDELQALAESGAILANAVAHTLTAVEPGITTNELNSIFEKAIRKTKGAEAPFLGYQGYPKSICTSVNDEVVHAIPSNRILKEGDIIGVDCGVRYRNMCTDMSRTVAVGKIDKQTQQLIDVTQHALSLGIQEMIPGNTIGDIGAAIQEYVEPFRYSIVRVLVGHGVGEHVHEDPQVPNYGKRRTGLRLEEGMVLAVEPMVNIGRAEVEFDEEDGWTVRTADGTLSAHFEDTIAITEQGPKILTSIM